MIETSIENYDEEIIRWYDKERESPDEEVREDSSNGRAPA